MLQFPRWRVDVTVDGDVVKTFQETATTAKAAIGKAKHKMRGAVSNAGPFKFKAVRADASETARGHAVKKSPAQLDREINEILGRGPRTHHARKATAARPAPLSGQSSAGFDIHTDHEDVVEDNARERFGPDYGDAADRAKRLKEGLVDEKGKITRRGWDLLNKDIATLERNGLAWLRKTFGNASDQGHDAQGGLIGSVSFDPLNVAHARNILMGKNERIDFSDASYGDFARDAWKGVSDFGQEVLGGSINFFDVDANALEIAEKTTDRADRRKRR
jgi:hypothetical protein